MKWLVLILLLAGIGYFIYDSYGVRWGAAEARACSRLGTLCGEKLQGDRRQKCERALGKLRSASGDDAVDKTARCIAESENCSSAMGCVAGAGLTGAYEIGKDFFEGLFKSISK